MGDILYITMLYDFYGELLTEKQRSVIENYYLNDMSLSEVGQEYSITKQAVADLVKRSVNILKGYEKKLKLYEKYIKRQKIIKDTVKKLDEAIEKNGCRHEEFESIIEELLRISE